MNHGNLFSDIPVDVPEELFERLAGSDGVRVERIISDGQSSPAGFWYDQEQNEWVMVLREKAGLRFADSEELVVLGPGEWIDIPAHAKHRVEWTEAGEKTIWLAVFY